MIPSAIKTVVHGTCVECGWVGFLGDDLCKFCLLKRAVVEHNAHDNDLRSPMIPPIVRVRKGWGN